MLAAASSEQSAWNRLGHARVSYLLRNAGIEHLVVKGVSTEDLLGTERLSRDVDVLVAPDSSDAAVAVLAAAGYTETFAGADPREISPHSRPLRAPDGPEVDVHHHFPGLDADPAATWAVLKQRATTLRVAGHDLPVPDHVTRVLLLGVAAARDGVGSRAASDFATAIDLVDPDELRGLAAELGALGPLRAGVQTMPDPAAVESRLRLDAVAVPERWQLLAGGASGVDRKWQDLREAGWRQRIGLLGRELLPTRSFMATSDPTSTAGRGALARAHLRRWQRLAVEVPRSARKLRRQRKAARGQTR
jgi:hypothetical protein